MIPKRNPELAIRDFDFDGTRLTVISDGADVYMLPEQVVNKLGLPWEKPQRDMTRAFAPVHFGGPPMSVFAQVAPQVIPFYMVPRWLMELLGITLKSHPQCIAELEPAALVKLKRFYSRAEQILSDARDTYRRP